jgi:hypothetical protein
VLTSEEIQDLTAVTNRIMSVYGTGTLQINKKKRNNFSPVEDKKLGLAQKLSQFSHSVINSTTGSDVYNKRIQEGHE